MEEHIRKDYKGRMQIAIGVAIISTCFFLLTLYAGNRANKENAELHVKNAEISEKLKDQTKRNDTLNQSLKDLVNEVQEIKAKLN